MYGKNDLKQQKIQELYTKYMSIIKYKMVWYKPKTIQMSKIVRFKIQDTWLRLFSDKYFAPQGTLAMSEDIFVTIGAAVGI